MHYTLSTRLLVAISSWCLARAGIEWQLKTPRDKRGRFRPKDGGGYGLPRTIPHHVTDLMHDLGITRQMYDSAAVPLVLPDDLEDVPALEVCLRMWILRNMDHWVNTKGRNVGTVMHALMCTWAITLFHYKPPKKMLRRFVQIADEAVGAADGETAAASHRSERFQRVSDFDHEAAGNQGARAYCPPAEFQQAAATLAQSALPLGAVELNVHKRAECPRSVPLGEIEVNPATGLKPSLRAPDPPWYGPPPHPPPSTHGTLKI